MKQEFHKHFLISCCSFFPFSCMLHLVLFFFYHQVIHNDNTENVQWIPCPSAKQAGGCWSLRALGAAFRKVLNKVVGLFIEALCHAWHCPWGVFAWACWVLSTWSKHEKTTNKAYTIDRFPYNKEIRTCFLSHKNKALSVTTKTPSPDFLLKHRVIWNMFRLELLHRNQIWS